MAPMFRYLVLGEEEVTGFREDLRWWRAAVKRGVEGVKIPLPRDLTPGFTINIFPDAAGPSDLSIARGLGWVIPPNLWGYSAWPAWFIFGKSISPVDISFVHKLSWMEALGPLWGLMALGNNCSGQTVVAWVDNLGAVFAFSKGYCTKCSYLNAIVHAAAVICQGLGTRLVVKHMPRQGVCFPYIFPHNSVFLPLRCSTPEARAADALSKGMISEAKKEVPSMATLVDLPLTLQKAISHPRIDGGVWGREMLVELKDRGVTIVTPFF